MKFRLFAVSSCILFLAVVPTMLGFNATPPSPRHVFTSWPIKSVSIENTSGVIVLGSRYAKGDSVRLYNRDGSLWYKFSFYENEPFKIKEDFRPFAFHSDYFLLVLKCVGRSKNRFEVVVNEASGMKKYVEANDPALRFETWEDHIVRDPFGIDFDRKENPVYEAPAGRLKNSDLPKGLVFHPVAIRGEWLKIRWNRSEQSTQTKSRDEVGWIRWKKDHSLLIEILYLC